MCFLNGHCVSLGEEKPAMLSMCRTLCTYYLRSDTRAREFLYVSTMGLTLPKISESQFVVGPGCNRTIGSLGSPKKMNLKKWAYL